MNTQYFNSVFTNEDCTSLHSLHESVQFNETLIDSVQFTPEDVFEELIQLVFYSVIRPVVQIVCQLTCQKLLLNLSPYLCLVYSIYLYPLVPCLGTGWLPTLYPFTINIFHQTTTQSVWLQLLWKWWKELFIIWRTTLWRPAETSCWCITVFVPVCLNIVTGVWWLMYCV